MTRLFHLHGSWWFHLVGMKRVVCLLAVFKRVTLSIPTYWDSYKILSSLNSQVNWQRDLVPSGQRSCIQVLGFNICEWLWLWIVWPDRSYSPDLVLSDRHLSPTWKKHLAKKHYRRDNDIISVFENSFTNRMKFSSLMGPKHYNPNGRRVRIARGINKPHLTTLHESIRLWTDKPINLSTNSLITVTSNK